MSSLNSLLPWLRIAAVIWAFALLAVLLSELRGAQRLVPDWLRNLSRIVVLVGTVSVLVVAALVGARMMTDALQARPEAAGGTSLDLSFESADAFLLSLYLSGHQEELNATVSDDPTPVSFVVELGETASQVAARLQEEGLIVDSEVFRRFMTFHGLDVSLEAGSYSLGPNMTMHDIAEALQEGGSNAAMVTIPEGWRAEQIGWLLEQQSLVRSEDFMPQVLSGQYGYAWLSARPPGSSLEGYLFPDTYEFAFDVSPATVTDLMLSNFDARVAAEIEAAVAGRTLFDLELGSFRPMTVHDVVTLASIVEREAVVAEERPIIASVYFNRLDPAYIDETALRLSSDPTIQYAKGYDPDTQSWWNPMLPGEGQTIESPYNTFKVQGLPPGPISNPGLASILAVLNPTDTDYLYFHAIGDGSHAFASTLEEHLRNQETYAP